MSLDASEDFMTKYPRPRGNGFLISAGAVVLIATSFIGGKMLSAPKQQISSDDAMAIIRDQQKIHSIQEKFQAEFDKLKKQADTEAAPYFKEANAIQAKVCKANGFTPDCQIDLLEQKVNAKAVPPPAAPAATAPASSAPVPSAPVK